MAFMHLATLTQLNSGDPVLLGSQFSGMSQPAASMDQTHLGVLVAKESERKALLAAIQKEGGKSSCLTLTALVGQAPTAAFRACLALCPPCRLAFSEFHFRILP